MPGFLGIGEMDFVRLIKSVPSGVLLVTFHVRGCGQSKPPDRAFPLDFYQQDADDCACMMEQLGFKQYSVLGWCLGGISATVLAADHPQNVKNLILLSSRALLTKQDLDRLETLKDVTTFKPKILRDLILAYGDVEMAQSTWSSFINTFFEIFNRGGDMCQSKLSKIQCPTAILQGVGDVLVPSFHAQYLHDHIDQSHLYMISDGLHALLQQFPAKIQKLIEALLIEGVFVPWDKL